MNRAVVVGYDGSIPAGEALTWAARYAARAHAPLRIMHVARTIMEGYGVGDRPLDLTNQVGRRVLTEGLELAYAAEPDLEITTQLAVSESASGPLVESSAHDRLLVVGSRGREGFAELLLGSVGITVAAHAECPVVVVRGTAGGARRPNRPVVVAVDGSATSARAVDVAFDHASWLGARLVAVHAWELPSLLGSLPPWAPEEVEAFLATETALLAESLAGHAERYPDVDVSQVVRRGTPARAILAESEDAELLVLGSRGRGGFRGLLLGSVSQAVLHHATCPVMIVRPETARR